MRSAPNAKVEKYRLRAGECQLPSTSADGNNGQFLLPGPDGNLFVQVSDGMGWEHVSVSCPGQERCPTWPEMDHVKRLFWNDDEVVVEFHVNDARKVNNHPYVLHLWRPTKGADLRLPQRELV